MSDWARLQEEVTSDLQQARTTSELEAIRVKYLGRKGRLTEVLRSLAKLSEGQRRLVGQEANALRDFLESALTARRQALRQKELEQTLKEERLDVTLPPIPFPLGHRHPITQTLSEVVEIFTHMGFAIADGPELETDYYNFTALNIPPDHPARDMQDTFYLTEEWLLRTHTSPVQIHVMERQSPPLRIVAPGRVFRHEAIDASHSAVFHQVEGLAVDEGISFSDLKGTLSLFVRHCFGPSVGLRFRPSYFPFTEPSAEVDVQCLLCQGTGCRTCGGSGWIEMLGAGMVHPKVFEAVHYDPERYTGFAFGLGVERIAMLKFGVEDMRLFYENDVRLLEQIPRRWAWG
ncbi:MAG: phenylalanine--tRNA ligase subunit alpha [Elusimicrobia bacterium]|nr:phenylalanine--tRNA ligase subunit alpha [Elusimicrobiota bacterium]